MMTDAQVTETGSFTLHGSHSSHSAVHYIQPAPTESLSFAFCALYYSGALLKAATDKNKEQMISLLAPCYINVLKFA
jgi:hypothetical protein